MCYTVCILFCLWKVLAFSMQSSAYVSLDFVHEQSDCFGKDIGVHLLKDHRPQQWGWRLLAHFMKSSVGLVIFLKFYKDP